MTFAEIKEGRRLISRMNGRKIKNLILASRSYKSKAFRLSGRNPANPLSLSIEPTTSCNLRCPECPSGLRQFTRPKGMLNPQLLGSILDQTEKDLIYLNLYFQGEPMLNPDFFELVRMARERGVFTNTSSNAHYFALDKARALVDSGLDRLIISIDGTDQDTYKKYRVGGKLEKVIEGTRNLVRAKKENSNRGPLLFFQFLVSSHNEHQIEDVKALGKSIGVDHVLLKSMQVMDMSQPSEFLPKDKKYSRYTVGKNGSLSIRGRFENECWRMWSGAVITWDGLVVPCCFDKDAEHQMGDLKKQGFGEIWNGEKYLKFRKQIFNQRSKIDMCKNCSEGAKVWLTPT